MSITTALSSALSGLTATSRAAEIVSSNVANAMTPGYARRELDLAARRLGDLGHGVAVVGVTRQGDPALLSERRAAEAQSGGRDVARAFFSRLEKAIGTGDAPGALTTLVSTLDAALLGAASRPESQARLSAVLDAAKGLAGGINALSRDIQAARTEADAAVAADVARLNDALAKVQAMNVQIRALASTGRDAAALMDQRQQLVDGIATLVPLREVDRGNGQIALFTTGGAGLLDGRAATVGFAAAGLVTEDMTLAGGGLSGLSLDGQAVPPGFLGGGRIAANLALRDDLAPRAQAQADALARDLVDRFADPALDPAIAPGGTGLFTAAPAPDDTGLARRLAVDPRADPAQGGALWRLRDGLGALAPGPAGDGARLTAMQGALTAVRTPASDAITVAARSFGGMAADLASGVAGRRLGADADAAFAAARAGTLRALEAEAGIDTDREMQDLLLIERAYAANARVVQTVDDMIQTLLGL